MPWHALLRGAHGFSASFFFFCVFEAEKASENGEAEAGEAGEAEEKEKKEDKEDKKGSTETFSFGRMCAFSNEVMGQKTEGWMDTWRLIFSYFSIFFHYRFVCINIYSMSMYIEPK